MAFYLYTIIWTLSKNPITKLKKNQHYFLGDDKFEQLV